MSSHDLPSNPPAPDTSREIFYAEKLAQKDALFASETAKLLAEVERLQALVKSREVVIEWLWERACRKT